MTVVDLYSDYNLCQLAARLVKRWPAVEAIERAKYLSGNSNHGIRLVKFVQLQLNAQVPKENVA